MSPFKALSSSQLLLNLTLFTSYGNICDFCAFYSRTKFTVIQIK